MKDEEEFSKVDGNDVMENEKSCPIYWQIPVCNILIRYMKEYFLYI